MNDSKSMFESKINWTAIVGAGTALGTVFGLDIDPGIQAKIVATVSAVSSALIIVWRTWFTDRKIF